MGEGLRNNAVSVVHGRSGCTEVLRGRGLLRTSPPLGFPPFEASDASAIPFRVTAVSVVRTAPSADGTLWYCASYRFQTNDS